MKRFAAGIVLFALAAIDRLCDALQIFARRLGRL